MAPPLGGGGGGGSGRFCGPLVTPPSGNDLLRRMFAVHCEAPRALLRPTPAGRSLNNVSPLLSRPVVMLYGSADEPCTFNPIRTPLASGVLKLKKMRWRTSCADGPQSESGFVLSDGSAVGKSA